MKVPYHQLGGKAKLLYDSFINWEKKQMNIQGELFGVHDWENVERSLVAHEMTAQEYEYHVQQNKFKEGVTFIDYKFIRKNNYLIFDEELKLENLGMNEGDVLDVKLSDTNQVFFSIRKPVNAI
tara:strand:- start:8 stop:379 length:372 start_codon:yes stop_codon:yes gene_type:complete